MMPACAIRTCRNYHKNTRGTDIKYFRFPSDPGICKKWVTACGRYNKINLKNARICSKHFKSDSYDVPFRQIMLNYRPKSCRNLKSDAIPELHLPCSTKEHSNKQNQEFIRCRRENEDIVRDIRKEPDVVTSDETTQVFMSTPAKILEQSKVEAKISVIPPTANIFLLANVAGSHGTNEINQLKEDIRSLKKRNEDLENQLKMYKTVLSYILPNGEIIIIQ